MDCTHCQFANWRRTAAGRLHPDSTGKCTWDDWKRWKLPPWGSIQVGRKEIKSIGYPFINRRDPYTTKQCPYFQEKK